MGLLISFQIPDSKRGKKKKKKKGKVISCVLPFDWNKLRFGASIHSTKEATKWNTVHALSLQEENRLMEHLELNLQMLNTCAQKSVKASQCWRECN